MEEHNIITALTPSNPMVRAAGWSLEISGSCPYEVIRDLLARFGAFHRKASGLQFAVGDAVLFAEEHFGEDAAQAIDEAGFSYSYIRDARWIAKRFKPEQRMIQHGLGVSHHKTVAGLPDADAMELLARAKDESWNRDELESQVQAWKSERGLSSGKTGKTPSGGHENAPDSSNENIPGDVETTREAPLSDDSGTAINSCPECGEQMFIAPCPHCFERIFVCANPDCRTVIDKP